MAEKMSDVPQKETGGVLTQNEKREILHVLALRLCNLS